MLAGDAAIVQHSASARANVLGLRRFEKDIFLNLDAQSKREEYIVKWREQAAQLRAEFGELGKAVTSVQDKDTLARMEQAMSVYESGFNAVYQKIQSGELKSYQTINAAMQEYKEQIHGLEDAAKGFSEAGAARMEAIDGHIRALAKRTMIIMLVVALLAIGLGSGSSVFITRKITKPLTRIIEELTRGSDQITSAAGQVAASGQSLAQGASEQATAIESVSNNFEQMTGVIRQNAASADETKKMAEKTKNVSEKGSEAVGKMSQAINDIKKSSDETSKIMKTIDEIAFQTNLLALNAAVEAARAGEAGKGFAVVAEELRNLAQRSANASKSTADMISTAIKNADSGVVITHDVSKILQEINDVSWEVDELAAQVSAGSSQQSRGVAEVGEAIDQMNKVTQASAASAEESASAAQELCAQSRALSTIVQELQAMVGHTEPAETHANPADQRRASVRDRAGDYLPVLSRNPTRVGII
jgi:methyl-accepting chemotaxis protein